MTPQQRTKSVYGPANELIGKLRETHAELAKEIAELGDRIPAAEAETEHAQIEYAGAKAEIEETLGELVEWRELLEDYRRGLVTRDELLEKTVGRG